MDNELYHYGTPHMGYIPHSGRYKYGSGDNPYQREDSFLRAYKEAHASGMSDKEFADARGMSTTELRARLSTEDAELKAYNIAAARRLKAMQWSNGAIAQELLGDKKKESTVRNWLKYSEKRKATKVTNTAADLERMVKEKGCIDVGAGVERELGISKEKLNAALLQLKDKGYVVDTLSIDQVTNPKDQHKTTVRYLALKGTKKSDLYNDLSKVQTVTDYSPDGGKSFWVPERPSSLDSDRIYVRYNSDKDGAIELRRGVEDISLGGNSYAQVRIAVDGTHYIKGMAHYADDIPDGYDVVVNSNKKEGTVLKSNDPEIKQVLKPLKADPDNPFGATIKARGQRYYQDKNGKYVKDGEVYKKATKDDADKPHYSLSPINILRDETDWDKYSKTLSAQFLSKQDKSLIKSQLNQTYKEAEDEFNDIMNLTNPTVKKKLLMDFAEQCDSSAVDLKATALPRQSTKVMLPITTIKENEVYAPAYHDGEHVVLVRYPYAGPFESPELIVNNRNKKGQEIIGKTGIDAIGLHPNTAAIMSGADFDGDTAMVIPVNDKIKVKTSPPLKGLKGFSTDEYSYDEQVPVKKVDKKTGETYTDYNYYRNGKKYTIMSEAYKQQQMGVVSNLITDMHIKGASDDEIERAVKHSMVVIDAVKHKLDYRASEKDNRIKQLKEVYQKNDDGTHGASTLISRSKAPVRVPERVQGYWTIDEKTGEPKIQKAWTPDKDTGEWPVAETGRTYKDRYGNEHVALTKGPHMSMVKDAHELSTGSEKEELYADYANKQKALANRARKEAMAIGNIDVSTSAKKVYASEIESLQDKLDTALRNAPKERKAQMIANQKAKAKIDADPDMDKEHQKRVRQQEITRARAQVGANKKDVMVEITPKEWEAIQAHAISTSMLDRILNNTDMDDVRKLATPRSSDRNITNATKLRIERMLSTGKYTLSEIADEVGVSVSTVSRINRNE